MRDPNHSTDELLEYRNIYRPWEDFEEAPKYGYAIPPVYDVKAFIDKLLDGKK